MWATDTVAHADEPTVASYWLLPQNDDTLLLPGQRVNHDDEHNITLQRSIYSVTRRETAGAPPARPATSRGATSGRQDQEDKLARSNKYAMQDDVRIIIDILAHSN